MKETQDNNSEHKEAVAHLRRLADIIFALAMAQCFLALDFPETLQQPTDSQVFAFLLAQIKPLTSYTIAFVIVGFYWIEHIKQFKYYKKSDTIHILLYLLYLMGMFLIPYSDTLIIYFPNNALVKICFSINTAFIGLISFLNWTYGSYKHRLIADEISMKTIITTRWRILVEPVFSLFTIAVALLDQGWWEYVWFLLPIPYLLIEQIFGKDDVENSQLTDYFSEKKA